VAVLEGHKDAVNGVSIHPNRPLLASCSGQRHFVLAGDDADEGTIETGTSITIWSLYWRFYRNFVALERACYKVAIESPIQSLLLYLIVLLIVD
jgi:hypothetical protein